MKSRMLLATALLAATVGGFVGVGEAHAKPAATPAGVPAAVEKTKRCKKNCAPVVTINISPAEARVGQTATLTWSASGATSCTASDAWSGAQSTSGSLPVTPMRGGRHFYTLACSSGSATASASAMLVVPIPVLPSSYENRMAAGDPSRGKGVPMLGGGSSGSGGVYVGTSLHVAWADFFQEGEYSLLIATEEKTAPNIPADLVGHFYALKLRNGRYEDHTAELLKDTTACLGGPTQSLVADFNGDGLPDVYQECYGVDVGDAIGGEDRLLLSQPDGTYSNTVVPGVGKHHGASAADLNGDGLPDVLETDEGRYRIDPLRQARALINNGDGTFRVEPQRLPDLLFGKSLTTFELIDIGRGVRDLFVSGALCGHESARPATDCPRNWLPAHLLLQNDGHGSFVNTKVTALPNPPGETGIVYNAALEFAYVDGKLYWLQVSGRWDASTPDYSAMIVHRLDLDTQELKRIFEHRGGPLMPGDTSAWFPHMVFWGDGTIHPLCTRDHAMQVYGVCALSFPQ